MNNTASIGLCKLCDINEEIDFTNDVVFCTLIGIKTIDKRGQETTIGDKYDDFFRLELKNMEKYFIVKLAFRADEHDKKAIREEFTNIERINK